MKGECHSSEFSRCMTSGCDETSEYTVVTRKVEAPVKS